MNMARKEKRKVLVFGIDGLPPKLIFEKYRKQLPNFSRLIGNGIHGRLRSTIPPSSIVAWTSLNSGRDPGETGIHSYTPKPAEKRTGSALTNSTNVKVPLLWDILGKHGKRTIALNVPLTYPARKINGIMVTDFLTPSFDDRSVYPPAFRKTVKKILHGEDYLFDVAEFTGYKKVALDRLIKRTYAMTKQHFDVAHRLFETEDWDLFDFVAIGSDRLHHMFWRHIDPQHENYLKNSPYKDTILDFYRYLDRNLGRFLRSPKLGKEAMVIVASDHGMDRMDNRFNLNDWLIGKGYLRLKEKPAAGSPKRLRYDEVDWEHTTALASGGYQGRIYIFDDRHRKKIAGKIMKELAAIRGPRGEKLNNKIFDTSKIYRRQDEEAPDIIVYFDNLIYGVNNDVGNKGLYSMATTVGIDDAGHAPEGSIIVKAPGLPPNPAAGRFDILQVAPTVLKFLGLPEYKKMKGKPLF